MSSTGIRATVSFTAPADCPVAHFSATTGRSIDGISTSVAPSGTPITEFLVDGSEPVDDTTVEPVFSYGTADVYRLDHCSESGCPCSCIGGFGCPIHRYTADADELTVVFHADGFEQLQEIMEQLRAQFPSVDVERLLQPPLAGDPDDREFVNRGKLTDRQLEVLQSAYNHGYFKRPKEANATELATELGITQSTFSEHLAAAQRKLFADVLDGA